MKKRFLLLASFLFFNATLANIAKAVCPVCVVAVGAGLGMSRWLGIDDAVSSIWIGALLVSLSIWTIVWLNKKKLAPLNAAKPQFRFAKLFNWVKNFKYNKVIIPLLYYLITIVPLYYYDIIGHPLNKIFGIDKIIFGIVLGTAVFLASVWFHNFLKTKNQGKQFFIYQKVILPLAFLILTSLIFYTIIKWRII
ncbi:MAG: hypothetical protein AAB529_02135 [Patescibacteria group bacterium]